MSKKKAKTKLSAAPLKRPPGRPKSLAGPTTFPTGIRIPIAAKQRLDRIAKREGVGYQTLMKRWVLERLSAEEQKAREQSGVEDLVNDIFTGT